MRGRGGREGEKSGFVVVVVLTGDFTNVFFHVRKWVHLIMGGPVPVDMTPLAVYLCTRPQ